MTWQKGRYPDWNPWSLPKRVDARSNQPSCSHQDLHELSKLLPLSCGSGRLLLGFMGNQFAGNPLVQAIQTMNLKVVHYQRIKPSVPIWLYQLEILSNILTKPVLPALGLPVSILNIPCALTFTVIRLSPNQDYGSFCSSILTKLGCLSSFLTRLIADLLPTLAPGTLGERRVSTSGATA